MLEVFKLIGKVAGSDATVLITGESGTGKELVAEALHRSSKRNPHPLVKVSCAALPETLLETELFGHEKGSFTGAMTMRKGRFETANKGTIFLDEIGEMTLATQTKLLRILQEREFERIGSNVPIKIDIRVITATNRDLAAEVEKGRFREDLYYRLNVIHIHMPPLRERKDDIPLLVEHFLVKYRYEPERHPRPRSPRTPWRASSTTTGRATCASSRTRSSAPSSSPAATRSPSTTCRSTARASRGSPRRAWPSAARSSTRTPPSSRIAARPSRTTRPIAPRPAAMAPATAGR